MEQEKKNNISKELKRFEKQIGEIYDALESVNLMDIEGAEEILKAAAAKAGLLKVLPPLMLQLNEMRDKKLKQDDIKGSATLSPLDDGTLN